MTTGLILNHWPDGTTGGPNDGTAPCVTAKFPGDPNHPDPDQRQPYDLFCTYSDEPPPLLIRALFTDDKTPHCLGAPDVENRRLFHEDFLTMPDTTPAGTVASTARSTAPGGWLLCYGQAVSRTTYAELFAAIGTTFGTGDGSTTFNLPDLRGRVPVGLDNMGGSDAGRLAASNTLGGSGGTETHTLSAAESGLPAHQHNFPYGTTDYTSGNQGIDLANKAGDATGLAGSDTGVVGGAQAASQAHNNMQPYLLLNHIIKT